MIIQKDILRPVAGLLALVLIGEIFTRMEFVSPVFLPYLSTIFVTLLALLVDPDFLAQVGNTMLAWAIGLGATCAVGIPLGLVLGASNVLHRLTSVIIELLRPMPSVALIPLAILLYGVGIEMKIFIIVYASVWPIIFNTISGIHDVDPVAVDTARSFGFGRAATIMRVGVPSAGPHIAAGIRIASSIALIVTISAEYVGGSGNGLGTYIAKAGASGTRPDLVYAATVLTGFLGIAISRAVVAVEATLLPYSIAARTAE